VALFDFFFVEPWLSFVVSDTQYIFTFALMLAVALVISQLAVRLRWRRWPRLRASKLRRLLARHALECRANLGLPSRLCRTAPCAPSKTIASCPAFRPHLSRITG
jgi:K+-sensing histidine kinase KdpD